MSETKNIKGRYPASSEHGNFEIVDTIGVPHPYCIGPRHVAYASDHCNGMLGEEAIKGAERMGAKCCIPNCNLSYEQHESALLIACSIDPQADPENEKELRKYLLDCKKEAEDNQYAGFAFRADFGGK